MRRLLILSLSILFLIGALPARTPSTPHGKSTTKSTTTRKAPAKAKASAARAPKSTSDVHVNGYTRKNGTQVQGHMKTAPNGTQKDNFSAKGKVNPYTGKKGTKTPTK
jgi:hypothetical protein